jgi:hypothetical protein
MIICTKEIYRNESKHSEKSQSSIKNKKVPKLTLQKNNGNMIDSGMVKCVEEHQRSNINYFLKDKPACKWGRKDGKIITCGDCSFGIQILENTPAYKTYLESWEARLTQWNWSGKHIDIIRPMNKNRNLK